MMNSSSLLQKNFKLGRIVRLGFGAIVVVMVGVGVSSKLSMNRVVETTAWVEHTHHVIGDINALEKFLVDAETGQRGFLFTGDETFLQPYTNALGEIDDLLVELQTLTDDNPEQQVRLDELEPLIDQKLAELNETIALKRQAQDETLMALVTSGQGKQLMEEIRAVTNDMEAAEAVLLRQRLQSSAQAVRFADSVTLGGTVMAIALVMAALTVISRRVILPIHKVAERLSSSSSDMTSTVQEQESSAQQQATAVQETSTTMDELRSSALRSAEHAELAAKAAQQVKELANSGSQIVSHTTQDMDSICRQVEDIVQQVNQLREQAQQIAGITSVVGDLANQTNVLALNAAVEAVRAGENGKGFAVVSAEIRKLADQSKVSATQIQDLIGNIQTAVDSVVKTATTGRQTVEKGAEMVNHTADTFLQVVESIDDIANSSQQISVNAKQQVNAIQQVVDAMNALNREAVRGASSISQTRVNAEQLNDAVLKLQVVV